MNIKLGFKGFTHPMRDEDVVPTLQKLITSALEHIAEHPEKVTKEETVGFLQMLLECTYPEKGYFFCPYEPSEKNVEIMKKYGKKILDEK